MSDKARHFLKKKNIKDLRVFDFNDNDNPQKKLSDLLHGFSNQQNAQIKAENESLKETLSDMFNLIEALVKDVKNERP